MSAVPKPPECSRNLPTKLQADRKRYSHTNCCTGAMSPSQFPQLKMLLLEKPQVHSLNKVCLAVRGRVICKLLSSSCAVGGEICMAANPSTDCSSKINRSKRLLLCQLYMRQTSFSLPLDSQSVAEHDRIILADSHDA